MRNEKRLSVAPPPSHRNHRRLVWMIELAGLSPEQYQRASKALKEASLVISHDGALQVLLDCPLFEQAEREAPEERSLYRPLWAHRA